MDHVKSAHMTEESLRRPVGSGVYERIRKDILIGRLDGGASLVELELARSYGTSRTPVREALRRLEQEGLVEMGRRVLRVRTRSPEEILEIYEMRIDLEPLAAGLAAERHTVLDLARFDATFGAMKAVSVDDLQGQFETNQDFQRSVWEASHNSTLVDFLIRLVSLLTRYPSTALSSPERWEGALSEYESLLACIRGRDVAGAREIARRHMELARDLRVQMYAEMWPKAER